MEKELGADVIKATQASLGKYVKRPPLTEKLLRKPPFRFLHDIVSTVLKTTGFFGGLFDDDELISENVKDRDSKIVFLNKVITVIGTTTGKSLTVKSSKIVAGQEPDKTNELLQCLAFALDNNQSSDEAVKKYKEGAKPAVSKEIKSKEKDTSKTVKKSTDSKKLASKSSEKLTTNKKESGTVNKNDVTISDSKTKKKENDVGKTDTQPKKSQQIRNKNTSVTNNKLDTSSDLKSNQKVTKKDKDGKQKEENSIKEENVQLTLLSKQESLNKSDDDFHDTDIVNKMNHQGTFNSSNTTGDNELNTPISSQDLFEVENNVNSTGNIEHSPDYVVKQPIVYAKEEQVPKDITKEITPVPVKNMEPVLTRNESTDSVDKSELENNKIISKGINNLSRKISEVVRPPSVRPSSTRPGAPRLREKFDNVIPDNDNLLLAKVNIIAENTNNEDEEDTSVIFVDQRTNAESATESQKDQLQLLSNEHGHLVQQILDSQIQFSQIGKTEIEWQFGAQKIKDAVNQEVDQLRFNIQALSRGANPLGKLMDHIQEDVEVMRQELQQWTKVYDEVFKEMQKQKTANEETLYPLQSRIKQIDMDIQEKHDKINDLKILIHKNVSRIEKLLLNGNVQ